jgi:hypothetical protein
MNELVKRLARETGLQNWGGEAGTFMGEWPSTLEVHRVA